MYQDVLDADLLPSIPVQPISYGDAEHFLSRISGEVAPEDWQGQINITYHIGPELVNRCVDLLITLNLCHNYFYFTVQSLFIWK